MVTISSFSIVTAWRGLGEEGWDRRGEEGLVLADADDQRALLAGADQQVRPVGVHGDEGVVPAQLGEGGADGGGEVAVVVGGDQVGDDLGVGFGGERLALGLEALAQLRVVLDDPVENDVDAIGAVAVGVGVLLGHPAVRRPAGVGDSGGRGLGGDGDPATALVVVGQRRAQVGEVADRSHAVDPAVLDDRDARGVVAAVLELLEPRDQQVAAGATSDVSDDSTHGE